MLDGDVPLDSHREGDGFDRCPVDGCIETEAFFHTPVMPRYMFSADPRKGGCGALWNRNTAQAAQFQHDHRHNDLNGRMTHSAEVGRVISIPSKKFSSEYARIFGHS